MENIKMIAIEKIHNHPDNPRKDVGDVTELAESIKHSGIMQNLTVVPFEGEYRVIIGHRRLAASKQAGLKELPCAVVEMSEKEQLGVMLCENMQRVDLTIVEQAQGMQLMLDLGDTVPEISKKTGLSKATVGKRIKLTALPTDKLKEAEGRGGTLEAYLKCLEIEDEKKRTELLDKVGTKDFEWKYDSFIKEQKWKKNIAIIKAMCKERGILPFKKSNERWSNKYEFVKKIYPSGWGGEDFRENLKQNKKYFYYDAGVSSYFEIYKVADKKKSQTPKKSEKEIEADRRRKELKELFDKAFRLREEFVLNFSAPKKYEKVIIEYLIKFTAHSICHYYSEDLEIINRAMGDGERTAYYPDEEKFDKFMKESPKALLVLTYVKSGDTAGEVCYGNSWNEQYPPYSKNSVLELVYEFLEKLGYQISTEEQQLLDGTHELYAESDEGEQ